MNNRRESSYLPRKEGKGEIYFQLWMLWNIMGQSSPLQDHVITEGSNQSAFPSWKEKQQQRQHVSHLTLPSISVPSNRFLLQILVKRKISMKCMSMQTSSACVTLTFPISLLSWNILLFGPHGNQFFPLVNVYLLSLCFSVRVRLTLMGFQTATFFPVVSNLTSFCGNRISCLRAVTGALEHCFRPYCVMLKFPFFGSVNWTVND